MSTDTTSTQTPQLHKVDIGTVGKAELAVQWCRRRGIEARQSWGKITVRIAPDDLDQLVDRYGGTVETDPDPTRRR